MSFLIKYLKLFRNNNISIVYKMQNPFCGECGMAVNDNKVCDFCKKLNLCINCEDLVEEKLDCGYCNKCSSHLQEIEKPKKILKKKVILNPNK